MGQPSGGEAADHVAEHDHAERQAEQFGRQPEMLDHHEG
jgi:hypothetical protein